jgi:hypothetical protein
VPRGGLRWIRSSEGEAPALIRLRLSRGSALAVRVQSIAPIAIRARIWIGLQTKSSDSWTRLRSHEECELGWPFRLESVPDCLSE